ncbi:hypothetical protein SEEN6805_02054 [Salmonella enterica subsp. enterica serovar Newport str. 36805]|nr:hypothetical protein SEEN6805_02054 [Salmonella enterica subsp. enterica serovar Newport str. 36805]
MGNEPIWKVERQPSWLVVAIKKRLPICLVDMLRRRNGWV